MINAIYLSFKFTIFLLATIGFLEASIFSDQTVSLPVLDHGTKFGTLVDIYYSTYLNHREIAKKIDAALSEKLKNDFYNISESFWTCINLHPGDKEFYTKMNGCERRLSMYHYTDEIYAVLTVLKNVYNTLPRNLLSKNYQGTSLKCVKIKRFYEEFSKLENQSIRIKLIQLFNQWSEEEQNFFLTLISKSTYKTFHMTDFKVIVDWSKFCRDSDVLDQVFEKIQIIQNILTTTNSTKHQKEKLDDLYKRNEIPNINP